MTRNEFIAFVEDFYGIKYDCPFEDDFETLVFRHPENNKWFALVMRIKKYKLGFEIHTDEYIDVVNLKCLPEIMDNLWQEHGVFPAYHMSKKHWLTLALNGECDDEIIKWVTNISFDLTKKNVKKRK